MTSALTAALTADSDHVACFDRDGTEHRWQAIVAAAAAVQAALDSQGGDRWALDFDDTRALASALLGVWAARKTAVLAPRALLASAELSIDGVLQAGPDAAHGRRVIDPRHLRRAAATALDISPHAELVLYTSGSTGVPKAVSRRVHNVESELAVLESLWGAELGACRVYATVAHRHVYGMLFRLLWPLLERRPFATFDLEYPEQLVDGRGSGHALVASPALLKRIGHLPGRAGAWRAVFSSGGLLTADVAADATRVLGTCPIEVLGSTETSGVAWRRQSAPDATTWSAMPRVETRAAADDFLEVRSPFTGHADWLRMGDLVRRVSPQSFELLGRGDHLAKIEDKRVSLAEIERYLGEHAWVQEAAAVALEDDTRQFVGAVVQLNPAGARELERLGRRAVATHLRDALRGRVEPVALPRRFRFVERLPADAQGKRQAALLKALFESR